MAAGKAIPVLLERIIPAQRRAVAKQIGAVMVSGPDLTSPPPPNGNAKTLMGCTDLRIPVSLWFGSKLPRVC